jgi:hypothetical protein
VSWRAVFLVNVVPGLLAGALVWLAFVEAPRSGARPSVDYAGAGLLTGAIAALLLGLLEIGHPISWGLLAASAALAAALVWVERRAPDPILPLELFRDRLFAVACLHGVLVGAALFGELTYVPLFVQAVLGTSATVAGSTLMPLLIPWVFASIFASRLLLRIRYRTIIIAGMAMLTAGTFLLERASGGESLPALWLALALMGAGMGFSVPIFLIVVQAVVPRPRLGIATSTVQFTRSIGGTLGVAVMGAWLSFALARNLAAAGLDPASVDVNRLLDPLAGGASGAALESGLRLALRGALQGVFLIGFASAVLAFGAALLTPAANIEQVARPLAPPAPAGEPVRSPKPGP